MKSNWLEDYLANFAAQVGSNRLYFEQKSDIMQDLCPDVKRL